MNHIIISAILFGLGLLISWIFWAWRVDKKESALRERCGQLHDETINLLKQRECLIKISAKILMCKRYNEPDTAQIMLELTAHPEITQAIDSEIHKQQEKEKCQE